MVITPPFSPPTSLSVDLTRMANLACQSAWLHWVTNTTYQWCLQTSSTTNDMNDTMNTICNIPGPVQFTKEEEEMTTFLQITACKLVHHGQSAGLAATMVQMSTWWHAPMPTNFWPLQQLVHWYIWQHSLQVCTFQTHHSPTQISLTAT